MAVISDVHRAVDLDDLLQRMAESEGRPRVLAGGTDLLLQYPAAEEESLALVDVTRVDALKRIEDGPDGLRIGAAVSLSDVMRSEPVLSRFGVLAEGAAVVAGPQIRNLATVGGNVCNASPSADTIPPLLVLNARAELRSKAGERSVALEEFFVGPGETVLEPGEILASFLLPWPQEDTVASYTKVSPRQAMDLAVVGVAVALERVDGKLVTRIALGAVAPTPLRATAAEEYIHSAGRLDEATAAEAGRLAEEAVSPIDDVRGSARYRRAMVRRVVARDLLRLYERLDGEVVA
ncbi:MAG: xanthine dehydrogenase family protein subunit M [Acidimicrobiia bacterium]|nr:xanthine dehydrogenase family protein subunit M [Acidimicrobiia bacterium]